MNWDFGIGSSDLLGAKSPTLLFTMSLLTSIDADRCFICERLLLATASEKWRASSGELIAVQKSEQAYVMIKAEKTGVDICVCEDCYKKNLFNRFSNEEIAEIHYQFGLEYRESGFHNDSIDALHRGLQLKPSADMLAAIALGYGQLGDYKLEHEFYRQALELDQKHEVACRNIKKFDQTK